MKFESIGLSEKEIKFSDLEFAAEQLGFVLAGQWDYSRVTLDYKIVDSSKNEVFYLRVPGYAVKGEIPKADCIVRLMDPLLGKYYYPHGVEYDEEFSKSLVDKCTKKLDQLKEKLDK
ncbi:MAG TPA: hypothetical protein GX525_08520 [Bacilli bacterium]|nr:hypothetical protein [Bacilli bacterium]